MRNKNVFIKVITCVVASFCVLLTSHFSTLTSQVEAAQTPNCEQVFGGGATCEQNEPITINKQIQNPVDQNYVDRLPAEVAYQPGQTVRFKLTVANTGDNKISNIVSTDTFPAFLEYSKGSGKYDPKTRTFTFTINELGGKSNKVFFIEAKVVSADKLPNNGQKSCGLNQGRVEANRKVSQDNVRVCVGQAGVQAQQQAKPQPTPTKSVQAAAPKQTTTKGGLPVYQPANTTKTPETGPETLALIGLAPLGALGFMLRRIK